MRILVVEDEAAIAAALQDLLTGEGHAIDVASTGPEAIEFSGAYPYDLVVLDVVLPGMDGRAVARTLRSKGNHAPILMLTALDEVEQRVAGLDAGADDYLAKPFAAAELHARVRALLRPSPSASPVAYCPLNGLPVADPELAKRVPILVQIENNPSARPPSGVNLADLVIESPVEGDTTRFSVVFMCSQKVGGPVRSAR